MRAYQTRKSATTVANPRKTKTVILAAELLDELEGIMGCITTGVGEAVGVVITAGALKRNVYESVSGASVALSNVYETV